MNTSECFAHDVDARNAWVALMPADAVAKIRAIAQPARRALYQDLDQKVKDRYLETLRDLNKEMHVVHVKGLGPVRQAKNQAPALHLILSSAAHDILIENGFVGN